MTETVLVAGTESHVGKSTVAAGLCRLLARRGVSVAPFKAQNMSNNARVAVAPNGGYGEIGVSQYVQARAARIPATTDMNPVLLKPRGDGESQLILQGKAVENVAAGAYYESQWERAKRAAIESYERLAANHDVIVAEGAGSIAEINLHHRDLSNVETARFANASILLLVNIERGGAFASLYGTLELMPDDVRDRVRGAVITKFRGDESLLVPGIEAIEDRTGVPILGVLPYDDPGLPEEDSVSLPQQDKPVIFGDDDDVPDSRAVTIGVPRLPRISNFTDLEPLANEPGVRVAYLPPQSGLDRVDAVVLPGSKNTVDDLLTLRNAGFDEQLAAFSGPVVGLCGGYQMLGKRITNASLESTDDHDVVSGFDLLPVETRFTTEKHVERVTRTLDPVGLLSEADGTVHGYEIHRGQTTATQPVERPIGEGSAALNSVLGTYLHGLFENENARTTFVKAVFQSAGKPYLDERDSFQSPYDAAADLLRMSVPHLFQKFVDIGR
ncbi:cobyric acid synthase [Haladaptatus sp. DYF46]|uniref:cobyric acid synthase n=1 Tax=Haladaptatus sp. DYF46 TaxID=2886041 RepID=UPI001E506B6B|nr:cobyric acid synthase [Haladaptatus sp. DYF46]